MTVRLYDTRARAKVDLEPRAPGQVSIYVCGPTVYDVPHIGHGRTVLVYDVIRRYLRWRGFDVTFVSNITDIEDKIIARAHETGATEPDLAQRFEAAYWEQTDRLGVERPDHTPHATEYVDAMLERIGELVDDGHAYVAPGRGVYFDVPSDPDYGALPHQRLSQLLESAGARVEVDDAKHHPVDFALWKTAKPGEPTWDSPWGPGRPGWHIECSTMALDLLGEGFDIHGAGDDLIFPHNENERAQAESAGHPYARHWLHSGMVEVSGEKMAKSLGNFRTLADALDVHGPRAFRLAVLQTHYRKATDLGDGELTAAASAVQRLDALDATGRGGGGRRRRGGRPGDRGAVPRRDGRRLRLARCPRGDLRRGRRREPGDRRGRPRPGRAARRGGRRAGRGARRDGDPRHWRRRRDRRARRPA